MHSCTYNTHQSPLRTDGEWHGPWVIMGFRGNRNPTWMAGQVAFAPTWASESRTITHERADAADGIMRGRGWTEMDGALWKRRGAGWREMWTTEPQQQNLTQVPAAGWVRMVDAVCTGTGLSRTETGIRAAGPTTGSTEEARPALKSVTRARQRSACCSYDVLPTLLKSCTVPLRARMRCCAVVDHRGSAARADNSATTASTLSTPPHPARCCSAPSG